MQYLLPFHSVVFAVDYGSAFHYQFALDYGDPY
jgi:hypothetical protein